MPEPRLVTTTVDGRTRTGLAEPRLLLSDFLRHELGLTGVHVGCEQGGCGSLHRQARRPACALLPRRWRCRRTEPEIDTVEGLARDGELHPIQRAFQERHGLQCGFCTPGMLLAAQVLLEETPDPSDAEIRGHLSGNVCRCTGYTGIVAAVREAARLLREAALVSRPFRYVGRSLPAGRRPGASPWPGAVPRRRPPARDARGRLRPQLVRARTHPRRAGRRRPRATTASSLVVTGADLDAAPEIVTASSTARGRRLAPPAAPARPRALRRRAGRSRRRRSSRYVAEDACELIEVDYEPLDAGRRPGARAGSRMRRCSTKRHGSNNFAHIEFAHGDVEGAFARAAHVVSKRFHFGRTHAAPLEGRGGIADWSRDLTVWSLDPDALPRPVDARRPVRPAETRVRVVVPAVGGGFGLKVHLYVEEAILPFLSRLAGAPVKWCEDRYEHLAASGHSKEVVCTLELALDEAGHVPRAARAARRRRRRPPGSPVDEPDRPALRRVDAARASTRSGPFATRSTRRRRTSARARRTGASAGRRDRRPARR